MAVEDVVLGMVMGGLGSLIMWLVVGKQLIMRYAADSIIIRIASASGQDASKLRGMSPDDRARAAISGLVSMLLTADIPTGRTVSDDDGREHPEVLPLLTYMGRSLFRNLEQQQAARMGGEASALARGKRKGQSTVEYLAEQMMSHPKVQNALSGWVEGKVASMLKPQS